MRPDLFRMHAELEDVHWWFCGRRTILCELVRWAVPAGQGRRVVDVGCGTGANIAALAAEYDCVGIDTSAEAIALASERFPGVRFVHGFAPGDVAQELETTDLLISSDVLEHVGDDFALLSSLLAVVPAGAHVLLTVPVDESLWSEHDVSFGHYRRYNLERFAALWAGLPVTVRLLSRFNSRLYPAIKAVRVLSRRRGRASGRGGTDLSLPNPLANRLLTRLFAGESARLLAVAQGRARPYRFGVSLLALLRREQGTIEPRSRPAGVQPDLFNPENGREP